VKIYLDTAKIDEVLMYRDVVDGFTSNPSMVKAAGQKTYRNYAKAMLEATEGKSTSLEVLADDVPTMIKQACELAAFAPNVVVKIPVTDTKGEPLAWVAKRLQSTGVNVNVTAIFTAEQAVRDVTINSIFCGRLSYNETDPAPVVRELLRRTNAQVLWAGVRSPYNIREARDAGAHIVTVPADSLSRWIKSKGMTPEECSLDTVLGFFRDGSDLTW